MATITPQTTTERTTWAIDPDHSQIGFTVRHMMFATVKGWFTAYDATIALDEADPTSSRVSVRVDTASVDTGVAQRDAHLRSADFFDADEHPQMMFESRRIESKGGGRWQVTGDLSIRGITRDLVLEVEEQGRGVDPWGGQRVGYSVSGKLDRTEYGLRWNQALEAGGVLVSDEVRLIIEVQLVRAS
jgi:polyisoprenoid-binding protein YceI